MLATRTRFLFADLEDAVTLGAEGWVTEGFEVLDLGLASIEALEDPAEQAELTERYHRAIVCYTTTYGDLPALPEPALPQLRVLQDRREPV